MHDGLRDEHSIERVSVRPRQLPRPLRVVHGDGELLEALIGDGAWHVSRHQSGLRQLAEAVLRGDFPSGRRADQHVVGIVLYGGTSIGGQPPASGQLPEERMGV